MKQRVKGGLLNVDTTLSITSQSGQTKRKKSFANVETTWSITSKSSVMKDIEKDLEANEDALNLDVQDEDEENSAYIWAKQIEALTEYKESIRALIWPFQQ